MQKDKANMSRERAGTWDMCPETTVLLSEVVIFENELLW